ncbi:MAG: hypothetical protein ABJE95_28860 [Byssovorax sp.]
MTEKRGKHQLLKSLLVPLLREWGYDLVRQCLVEVHVEHTEQSTPTNDRPTGKEHRRLSASEIVERTEVDVARKKVLSLFATRFDAKTFLPSAADVRHFLDMRGQDPGVVKHRQDAFRKVLDVLLSMPDDELEHLQASNAHSGPTQLGPLADAIMETSTVIRTGQPTADPQEPHESTKRAKDAPKPH